MLLSLTSYHYIVIFSTTIIVSYFFNLYAKKSGIPAVLMLIGLGVIIKYVLQFSGVEEVALLPIILKVLGTVGLILIVLEAALDLRLLKEKIGLIVKSFLVALLGFVGTAYFAGLALTFLMDVPLLNALLYTIPLSILSSAIILPSIDALGEAKREFMIYESTFSDIIGIVVFFSLAKTLQSTPGESVYGDVFGKVFFAVIFSVIISYILIYVFQKIKGHIKLFLLIAVLLLLYAVGKMLGYGASLIIILIFGVILNNYQVFFRGGLINLLVVERVEEVLDDMKVVTAETAFVVRTFFFIIFGWSVSLGSLLNFKVLGIGVVILAIIYIVRAISLFIFNGRDINPQLFLAPRGLITILLFFEIPEEFSLGNEFQGILLFVILASCLIMTLSLIAHKNKLTAKDVSEEGAFLGGDGVEEISKEKTSENI